MTRRWDATAHSRRRTGWTSDLNEDRASACWSPSDRVEWCGRRCGRAARMTVVLELSEDLGEPRCGPPCWRRRSTGRQQDRHIRKRMNHLLSPTCSLLRELALPAPLAPLGRGAAARRRGSSRCRGRGRTRSRRGAGRRSWLDTSSISCANASASPKVLPTPPGKSESPVKRCGWPSGSSYSSAIEPGVWPASGDHLERARRRRRPCRRRRPAGSTGTPVCS